VPDRVHWVFGYGSLVSPLSLEITLGREVPREPGWWAPAELHGYGRSWNYGSLTTRATWEVDGRRVERGLVVSLGLVDAPLSCNGVIVRVNRDDVARLDRRERDYDRVDVTDRIDAGGEVDGRVVTYVPRPGAVLRYERYRDHGRAAISRRYVDLVTSAFEALGPSHRERYAETTMAPDVPIVDLDATGPDPSPPHLRTER
jgi:cation transport regulator ChaC